MISTHTYTVHTSTYTHTHTHTHTHPHTHTHTSQPPHTQTHTHPHPHTHRQTHTHTPTPTPTHTHTHTHTHTYCVSQKHSVSSLVSFGGVRSELVCISSEQNHQKVCVSVHITCRHIIQYVRICTHTKQNAHSTSTNTTILSHKVHVGIHLLEVIKVGEFVHTRNGLFEEFLH